MIYSNAAIQQGGGCGNDKILIDIDVYYNA